MVKPQIQSLFYPVYTRMSVLGPILFLNDLRDNIKSSVRLFADDCVLNRNIHPLQKEGGQSRGQHDWVHGFPEPVKSVITFVIEVQPHPPIYFSVCSRLCQSFSSVCCSFPDYLDQLKIKRKILRDWVHTSVGRSNLENCSEPRKNFYTVLCRKI